MKISGSSIASYYAGNAALGIDSQAARQARETSQASHSLKEVKPASSRESVLEGELLNEHAQSKPLNNSITGEEFFARPQVTSESASDNYTNQAIAAYKHNAGLDDTKPLQQLDIFV